MVNTNKKNWIVGIKAFHNNHYDEYKLEESMEQVERLIGWKLKETYVA